MPCPIFRSNKILNFFRDYKFKINENKKFDLINTLYFLKYFIDVKIFLKKL